MSQAVAMLAGPHITHLYSQTQIGAVWKKMEKNRLLSVTGISQAMKAQKFSLITEINNASYFANNNISKLMKSLDLKNKAGRATRIPTTKTKHNKKQHKK